MSSKHIVYDETTTLPPMIILNQRRKIEATRIHVTDSIEPNKAEDLKAQKQLVYYEVKRPPPTLPLSPLHLTWFPDTLNITLETEIVVTKLWIMNLCPRPIYIHVCGLWEETARFGASWCCYPRTRIWMPTGLKTEIRIKAKPRDLSPIPCTPAYLQIAAECMRDNVTGYFAVPIFVKFLNYVPPGAPSETDG